MQHLSEGVQFGTLLVAVHYSVPARMRSPGETGNQYQGKPTPSTRT